MRPSKVLSVASETESEILICPLIEKVRAAGSTTVRYIDSSGVASLVEGLKASRDVGSRFVLFGLNTTVREVLQLSKLVRIFEIYENEDQAVAT